MKARTILIRVSLGCALLALLGGVLGAQQFRARVQGIVTDSSQAVIPGAQVTLLNTQTGVAVTRQTDGRGWYLFDYVDSGKYSVTVEHSGFAKFQQENVLVQIHGDVTVNAVLTPGAVKETVTVKADPPALQFNSSNIESTLDTTTIEALPNIGRNVFALVGLDPAVERDQLVVGMDQPWWVYSASYTKVAGTPENSSDIQVDGSSTVVGLRETYHPSLDAVQELSVQQNAVDAEYGNSLGSSMHVALKSGTNAWHGDALYNGQYPWANALEDRHWRSENENRRHIIGGTLGNPIPKNRLFNFFSYERWKEKQPWSYAQTQPTALEKTGDFSQSKTIFGGLRTIYDPWSSTIDTNGNLIRTPFPNNVIPPDRLDPVAVKFMQDIWEPNRAGDDLSGTNNYFVAKPVDTKYWNLSDRVDYNLKDRWRFYGRFSRSRMTQLYPAINPSPAALSSGSTENSNQYSGDVVYTLGARTVINAHGDWSNYYDAGPVQNMVKSWDTWWPNDPWYKQMFPSGVPFYYPRLDMLWRGYFGGSEGTWLGHPVTEGYNVKIAHQQGSHYLKAGLEIRHRNNWGYGGAATGFGFSTDLTADNCPESGGACASPDTRYSGDPYATFLLGAIDAGGCGWCAQTSAATNSVHLEYERSYAPYVNDDWKVNKNLTLTLGLRYEYAQPFRDPQDRLSRGLDLTNPIPEMQQNPPQIPALVQQFYNGPYIFNGAWVFTNSSQRGMWNGPKDTFLPRVGAAYRLNNNTVLHASWARFALPFPQDRAGWSSSLGNISLPGYDREQGPAPPVQGVPQVQLQNPWPDSYPVLPVVGKGFGRYTGLGDSNSWIHQARKRTVNNRFSVAVQRALPGGFVADVTYLLSRTSDISYSRDLNAMDPRLSYQYKGALNVNVPNPFFNYMTPDTFPGALRNQPTVPVTQFMRPYPQYGSLSVILPGGGDKYQSIEFKVQRTFSKGYSLMGAYVYRYQDGTFFFNDIAAYDQHWTWQASGQHRHRLSMNGVWELPFGKGRTFMASAPRVLDAAVGGWNLSSIVFWRSGDFLQFGPMVATGSPVISHPTLDNWFNTSVFQRLPDYTPRTNPYQYAGLTGPGMFNMDADFSKSFRITEGTKVELKLSAFNALNGFTPSDPDTSIYSAYFGKSIYQRGYTFGRKLQFGLKFLF